MKILIIAAVSVLVFITGCTNLLLKPADFGWPVESVLKVDNNGMVIEKRYSFSFNTRELFLTETSDSSGFRGKDLRLIRNNNGYYFITANNFKNVYVFYPDNGSLVLSNKIAITDSTGMTDPAFNQRTPYIELIYNTNRKLYLNNDGIFEENSR
jgi:hypothetical protein